MTDFSFFFFFFTGRDMNVLERAMSAIPPPKLEKPDNGEREE